MFHLMNALDRHFLPKSTLWKHNVLETAYQVTITKFNLDLVFMGKNKDINHSKATNTQFLFLYISILHLYFLKILYTTTHIEKIGCEAMIDIECEITFWLSYKHYLKMLTSYTQMFCWNISIISSDNKDRSSCSHKLFNIIFFIA